MKLSVDATRCTGHGRCYTLAPGLLSYDDDGFVTVRGETIDVPDEHADSARAASLNCPERAIELLQ